MTTLRIGSIDVKSTRLLSLLTAVLVLSAAAAASAETPVTGRRVCVFTIQNLTSGGADVEYAAGITDTLEQEFEGAGARIIRGSTWGKAPRMPQDTRDLLWGPAALAVAEDVGADLAVNGSYSVEGDQILVSLQCWDVAAKAPMSGFLRVWRFNLAFYNSLHEEIVSRLVPRITFRGNAGQPAAEASATAETPASRPTEITFLSAQDGMQVFVEGETPAGMIENGRLSWSAGLIPRGTQLRVEKRQEGFHPAWQKIEAEPEVILSGLTKKATQAVELDWTLGQLVGLGATLRGYWNPDTAFTWYANYLSLQLPASSGGRPMFHYDTGIGIGSYIFFPAGSPVRFGLSTGAGAVFSLSSQPGSHVFVDLYLNVINWWVEAKLWGITTFFRQELKFAAGLDEGLLKRGLMMVGGSLPPMTVGIVVRR